MSQATAKCEACGEGYWASGVPGVLAHVEAGVVFSDAERCDACERFASDDAARDELLARGFVFCGWA